VPRASNNPCGPLLVTLCLLHALISMPLTAAYGEPLHGGSLSVTRAKTLNSDRVASATASHNQYNSIACKLATMASRAPHCVSPEILQLLIDRPLRLLPALPEDATDDEKTSYEQWSSRRELVLGCMKIGLGTKQHALFCQPSTINVGDHEEARKVLVTNWIVPEDVPLPRNQPGMLDLLGSVKQRFNKVLGKETVAEVRWGPRCPWEAGAPGAPGADGRPGAPTLLLCQTVDSHHSPAPAASKGKLALCVRRRAAPAGRPPAVASTCPPTPFSARHPAPAYQVYMLTPGKLDLLGVKLDSYDTPLRLHLGLVRGAPAAGWADTGHSRPAPAPCAAPLRVPCMHTGQGTASADPRREHVTALANHRAPPLPTTHRRSQLAVPYKEAGLSGGTCTRLHTEQVINKEFGSLHRCVLVYEGWAGCAAPPHGGP
jgi:hypothetical protein